MYEELNLENVKEKAAILRYGHFRGQLREPSKGD